MQISAASWQHLAVGTVKHAHTRKRTRARPLKHMHIQSVQKAYYIQHYGSLQLGPDTCTNSDRHNCAWNVLTCRKQNRQEGVKTFWVPPHETTQRKLFCVRRRKELSTLFRLRRLPHSCFDLHVAEQCGVLCALTLCRSICVPSHIPNACDYQYFKWQWFLRVNSSQGQIWIHPNRVR